MIAGGGTGGHLFPGLAVAERLRETGRADHTVFFGALSGIEARVVEPAGFTLIAQDLEGIRGRGAAAAVRAALKFAKAITAARIELKRRKTDVVVGLGGYASAPGVAAAALSRIPVVLLEQNRKPGMANRVLARVSAAVCTSFPGCEPEFPAGLVRHTGNPLRAGIDAPLSYQGRDAILVFGGSAGAHSLNSAVIRALAGLALTFDLPPIVHQTGVADEQAVRAAYEQAGIAAQVTPFIDDMAAAYARARLAICRAGATSVAELAATGTPAVLVPFPAAAGNHQTENARAVEAGGAALCVTDDDQTAASLERVVGELLHSSERLDSMAGSARGMGLSGAADRVLAVLEEVARAAPRPQ